MLTLSPSDSACRWVFYIWLKQIQPVLLWRVLHFVKSHYYGNVRVLEIMARWEQLDCLWHNNPTLSISSASSLSHSLYCIPPPLLYTSQSLSLTHLSCWSQSCCFFIFTGYLLTAELFYHLNQTLLYESCCCGYISTEFKRLPFICCHISTVLLEMIWYPASICCC